MRWREGYKIAHLAHSSKVCNLVGILIWFPLLHMKSSFWPPLCLVNDLTSPKSARQRTVAWWRTPGLAIQLSGRKWPLPSELLKTWTSFTSNARRQVGFRKEAVDYCPSLLPVMTTDIFLVHNSVIIIVMFNNDIIMICQQWGTTSISQNHFQWLLEWLYRIPTSSSSSCSTLDVHLVSLSSFGCLWLRYFVHIVRRCVQYYLIPSPKFNAT